jgi:hypothetical protein
MITFHAFLLKIKYISDKICTQNQNTYFVFSIFFSENRAVYEKKKKKYCGAVQAIDDNMAHAHCMLDT